MVLLDLIVTQRRENGAFDWLVFYKVSGTLGVTVDAWMLRKLRAVEAAEYKARQERRKREGNG